MKPTLPTAGSLGITVTPAQLLAGYAHKPATVPGWLFNAFEDAARRAFSGFPAGSLTGEAYDVAKAAFAASWVRDTLPTLPAEMLNDWKPETRALLASLRAAGFTIAAGNNGEGKDFAPTDYALPEDADGTKAEHAFLGELLACDEASLFVTHPAHEGGKRRVWLFLVLGNSPGELVSDYGIPSTAEVAALLDTVTRAHGDSWEGREQPREVSRY